MTLSDP